MNTAQGGKKLRETMIKKHGSEQAWKEFMRNIGSVGGKKEGIEKGFSLMSEEKHKKISALGGTNSRRTKK